MIKRLFVVLMALGLSGCAGVNIDNFKTSEVKGSPFTQALVKEYKSFVAEEAAQYDWVDADHFAQKGLRALAGEDIAPENPADWGTPSNKLAELTNYYHRLDYILNNGAKKSSPVLAAHALGKFDCWVEQQEENHQPSDIAECRTAFMQAFAELEKAEPKLAAAAKKYAATKPSKKSEARSESMKSGEGTIYFDYNSAKLGKDDIKAIKQAAKDAGKKSHITISGHTDTAGTESYNRALSHRRAMAVRQVLINSGVPSKHIKIEARGENDLAIQTGDGVREAKNRRAVLTVD